MNLTRILICSHHILQALNYSLKYQLEGDDLVVKISNMTRPLVKILKFLHIFVLSNFSNYSASNDLAP